MHTSFCVHGSLLFGRPPRRIATCSATAQVLLSFGRSVLSPPTKPLERYRCRLPGLSEDRHRRSNRTNLYLSKWRSYFRIVSGPRCVTCLASHHVWYFPVNSSQAGLYKEVIRLSLRSENLEPTHFERTSRIGGPGEGHGMGRARRPREA